MSRLALGLGVFVAFAGAAKANLIFDLTVMTNGFLPVGSPPYARATFKTIGVNTVELTMENLGTTSGMEIMGWYFNVNLSAADISGMTFTYNLGQVANAVTFGSNHSAGVDASSHAGLFDIVFDFPPPPGNDKFSPGEISRWTITGNGLTENSFNIGSANNGSDLGGWSSAARIQSYLNVNGQNGASGTLGDGDGGTPQSVPEPFTMALMGGAAIAGYRKLRRRSQA